MRAAASLLFVLCVWSAACGGGAAERPAPASADDALDRTERSVPQASVTVQQGEQKLAAGDAEGAKTLFEQAIAADAGDARAQLDLGITLESLDDAAGAEAAYRKAVAVQPSFAEALNNLGVLLRDRGDLGQAVPLLQRAVRANAESAAAHGNLALALEDQGDVEGAKQHYAAALRITPADAMLRANYGLLLLQQKDADAAKSELQKALPDAKGNRAALLAIGNGLRRAGDPQGALQAMQGAVSAGPGEATPALLSELALAQRAAGQRDEAIATLRKVIAQDAKYATAQYVIANMLAADKNYAEAKKHYEQYLKLEPNGEQATSAKERLAVVSKLK